MKANTATKQSNYSSSESSSSADTIELITGRQSNELIIGFCGPIGAGIKAVRTAFEDNLKNLGYETHHIHISSLMDKLDGNPIKTTDAYDRYIIRQEQGNRLREKFNPQILAEAAIFEMTKIKQKAREDSTDEDVDGKFKGKNVYFIDQLKNTAEVELLRLVYQNNFYLIGVLRSESERKRNLRDESISPQNIDVLIHKDRKSGGRTGQQAEKTILDADFFIRNNQSHIAHLSRKVSRFVNLIHGKNGISPSLHEKGMFNAFSASMQSACLSRQVGASIVDDSGNTLATGRNDVPKSGGGLYTFEDADNDFRCIHKGGRCYNDLHKNKIKSGIKKEIETGFSKIVELYQNQEDVYKTLKEVLSRKDFIDNISNDIFEATPINALIEYSRAIHAEMDAITSLARSGDGTTKNKIMFTTTYPCHNCARHIVASGIKEVYYIEPYEKSLALDLHDDAINDANNQVSSKVNFIQFEGVSPRRYQKFFLSSSDRKDDSGMAYKYATKYANHVDIQFLDSYQTIEDKISEEYVKRISTI